LAKRSSEELALLHDPDTLWYLSDPVLTSKIMRRRAASPAKKTTEIGSVFEAQLCRDPANGIG
jgi:hypothetical protein